MKSKTLLIIIMCLNLVFLFAACGSGSEISHDNVETSVEATEAESAEEAVEELTDEEYLKIPDMSVFIAIDYSDASDREDVEDTMIEMSKEQTAADALRMFAEAEGLEIDIDEKGNVKSINGVEGKWVCEINGEETVAGGMTIPEDGDDVYWIMQ